MNRARQALFIFASMEELTMAKTFQVAITLIVLTVALLAQNSRPAEVELRAAQQKAEVEGDLSGAIKQYQAITTKYKNDRGIVAMALVRMAECYEKLGDTESRKLYQRVVREYADVQDQAAVAKARLDKQGNALASDGHGKRLLCSDCGDYEDTISADGRYVAFADYATGDAAIRDLFTGETKRVTAKPGTSKDSVEYAEEPVLSPDLRRVA